jgi:hypothetical protein
MDLGPLMKKYGVTDIVDQYHSGLEHTFLWVVKTTAPHKLEEFSIELGVARWNDLKFVPERTEMLLRTFVRCTGWKTGNLELLVLSRPKKVDWNA